jgi:hypothetical protein
MYIIHCRGPYLKTAFQRLQFLSVLWQNLLIWVKCIELISVSSTEIETRSFYCAQLSRFHLQMERGSNHQNTVTNKIQNDAPVSKFHPETWTESNINKRTMFNMQNSGSCINLTAPKKIKEN